MESQRKALTPPEVLKEYPELAKSVDVLANWRASGRGPRYYKVGLRRVVYKPEDIEAFLFCKPVVTKNSVALG